MAPEQIEGRQLDGRADVYALGCVLFECLTGRPPFVRENEVAVLWAHIRDEPPLPSEVNRALPRAFDGIVDRALAKDPHDRYESAGALAADLRVASRPKQRARRARLPRARTRGRKRWVVPVLAGLVVGAAAGGVVAVVTNDTSTTAPTAAADPYLLQRVPASFQASCIEADPPSPDFSASVTCTPSDPNITSVHYSHAVSGARMRRQLLGSAYAHGAAVPGQPVRPGGSCPRPESTAVRDWTQSGAGRAEMFATTPGSVRGRLLCYTSPFGWSAVEWSDTANDVYSVAYGKNRYAVYRWWRVRGGPAE